jgi:hypothetical protein
VLIHTTTHVLAVKVCALRAWLDLALPPYTRTPPDPPLCPGIRVHAAVTAWFNRPGGEARSFDLLPTLAQALCPTLVLGSTHDPMLPIECQRDIAAALSPHLLRYREFEGCGHGVVQDTGDEALALLRELTTRRPAHSSIRCGSVSLAATDAQIVTRAGQHLAEASRATALGAGHIKTQGLFAHAGIQPQPHAARRACGRGAVLAVARGVEPYGCCLRDRRRLERPVMPQRSRRHGRRLPARNGHPRSAFGASPKGHRQRPGKAGSAAVA